jgi:hypothetical protein
VGNNDKRPDHSVPRVNNGILITGGTSYVGSQAVGPGAHAHSGTVNVGPQDAGQQAQVAELLVIVERLLEEHHGSLADPDAAAKEVRRLRDELDEDEPRPPVLRRALNRLTELVEPVAPLLEAVALLTQAIQLMLGN